MQIEYNGNLIETRAHNLQAFLQERRIRPEAIAVAADGVFVPRSRYESYTLTDGARLEVLTPTQGG